MRNLLSLFCGLAVLLTAGTVLAQLPPDWALNQNFPNPFCNESSITKVQFALPQQSEVLLEVWSPDTSLAVRILVNATLAAGYHEVAWDGRDDFGALLENADYPYSLTATQVGGGAVLFESMLVASIHCVPIGTDEGAWGRIKTLFTQ